MVTKKVKLCDSCEIEEDGYEKAVAKCMYCKKDLCDMHACVLKIEFDPVRRVLGNKIRKKMGNQVFCEGRMGSVA